MTTDTTDGRDLRDPDPYAAGQIVGHASDEDAGADIGVSVGLGQGRMLYFGDVSDKLLAEHGATGLGGTGGWWAVVFGQDAQATQVLGKLAPGFDAQGIARTVARFVQPAHAPDDLREALEYLRPTGHRTGGILLQASQVRSALDTIEAALARLMAERVMWEKLCDDGAKVEIAFEARAEAAEARCDRLTAENAKLQAERDAMRKALKACEDAAMSATYGPPSGWPAPGHYPRGWRHPPGWPADRRPTPEEACWHDNGVLDARLAVRGIVVRALGESALAQAGRAEGENRRDAGHG